MEYAKALPAGTWHSHHPNCMPAFFRGKAGYQILLWKKTETYSLLDRSEADTNRLGFYPCHEDKPGYHKHRQHCQLPKIQIVIFAAKTHLRVLHLEPSSLHIHRGLKARRNCGSDHD